MSQMSDEILHSLVLSAKHELALEQVECYKWF